MRSKYLMSVTSISIEPGERARLMLYVALHVARHGNDDRYRDMLQAQTCCGRIAQPCEGSARSLSA